MESHAAPDQSVNIELLLSAAEARIMAQVSSKDARSADVLAESPDPDKLLVSAARREIERRRLRSQFLPPELISDTGWAILLDLLAGSEDIFAAGCGRRWDVSDATAARHIAALIESRLVRRVQSDDKKKDRVLRLTAKGRHRLCVVLNFDR